MFLPHCVLQPKALLTTSQYNTILSEKQKLSGQQNKYFQHLNLSSPAEHLSACTWRRLRATADLAILTHHRPCGLDSTLCPSKEQGLLFNRFLRYWELNFSIKLPWSVIWVAGLCCSIPRLYTVRFARRIFHNIWLWSVGIGGKRESMMLD